MDVAEAAHALHINGLKDFLPDCRTHQQSAKRARKTSPPPSADSTNPQPPPAALGSDDAESPSAGAGGDRSDEAEAPSSSGTNRQNAEVR